VSDSNGVTFVPALVGLGAPHWRDDVRGIVGGLSLGTRPAHLARAALEAIAFQVADVLRAMEADVGVPMSQLRADGGASRNDFLMQFQADIIDRPVVTSEAPEVSALGAAALAWQALGHSMPAAPAAKTFMPAMPEAERRAHRDRWQAAIGLALGTPPTQSNNEWRN
jgi:glycerol kinase